MAARAESLKAIAKIAIINLAVLLGLLVLVELIFGNWVRPLTVQDLKRFSIPVNVHYTYDVSTLYRPTGSATIRYTRDAWGLRGTHERLQDIDVLTVGGSTTDQKFLDDAQTWQAFAQSDLAMAGRPMTIANAGVDGQSTTGHLFDFYNWFTLIPELKPKVILFYVGINDVMKTGNREDYDMSLDASSWRVKSALWQMVRLVRGTMSARNAQVVHGRKQEYSDVDFTEEGVLDATARIAAAEEVTTRFLANIDELSELSRARGATPVFLTQGAYGWNAGPGKPRGIRQSGTVNIHGRTMNYADVSFLHQQLNAGLMSHCRAKALQCFDLASELPLEADDYYDWLHTTPSGAQKIGNYVAQRLASVHTQEP